MNDTNGMGNDSMADNAAAAVSGPPGSEVQQRGSRAQARQAREQAARAQQSAARIKNLLRRWWIYPIVVAAVVCIYLGYQSANMPVPSQPQVVVNVPTN